MRLGDKVFRRGIFIGSVVGIDPENLSKIVIVKNGKYTAILYKDLIKQHISIQDK